MQKLLFLIVLTLAACVAYVAMTASGAGAGAGDPGPGTYKCYQARHVKRSPRFQSERVFLTDQFRNNVEVSVLKLGLHCAEAEQDLLYDGSPAGNSNRGLDCYNVRDVPGQPRFAPQNIDVEDSKMGSQTLTVSKVASYCAPGLKNRQGLDLEGGGFICYKAKTAKGHPRFQPRDISISDQFSEKNARILRPIAYCSVTDKKFDATNDDFGDARQIDLTKASSVRFHLSTVHATLAGNDPITTCKTEYTNSVWYEWSSGQNESLMIDTFGSSYDTVLAAYTGDKGNLQQVGCNDDVKRCSFIFDGVQAAGCVCPDGGESAGCVCQAGGPEAAGCCPNTTGSEVAGSCPPLTSSFLQVDARAGVTYHILVGSSDGHGGKLKFRVSRKVEDTDADSCADPHSISSMQSVGSQRFFHLSTMDKTVAEGVSVGVGVAGSGPCNTNYDPDLSCAGTYGASIWFTYTPPAHQIVNFETSSSSYPTVIGVFDTTLGGYEVACGASGDTTATLKAGRKYLIMVGSSDAANNYDGGKLKLLLTLKDQLVTDGQSAGVEPQRVVINGMVCYQVRQARHSTEIEDVTDQFSDRQLDGAWTLSIGSVNSICLPTLKTTCTRYVELNTLGEEGEAARLCITT